MSRMGVFLLISAAALASLGCTNRAWYEGFQERQRQECFKNRGQDEIQQCLDRVNSTTYDEYMKARKDTHKVTN